MPGFTPRSESGPSARIHLMFRSGAGGAALALVLAGCSASTAAEEESERVEVATWVQEVASSASPTPEPGDPVESPQAPSEPVEFTLVMAGDMLPHASVNKAADAALDAPDDGTYDFTPLMEPVRPWIENADIALCSLEVPLAPPGRDISAYPVFAAPNELTASLQALGWDGCATATNHSLDSGVAGLEHTLEVMDSIGMGHTGTGRTPEETVSPQFYEVEKDGATITIAHLSATTFHNDYTDPSQYAQSLHALEAEQIDRLAAEAREAGADIVVFTPHWGQEYWHEPDGLQQEIAATLAAGGNVDVVMGGHAHVPQPIVNLDGGVHGDGMWVAYSMGNFLSNQDEECCDISTASGLIMRAQITADPGTGEARVTGISWSGASVDTDGGQLLHPMQALVDGERPEGLTLTDDRIAARWDDLIGRMGEDLYDPAPPESGGAVVRVVPRG